MVPAFSRRVYLFGELLSALSDISDQLLVHFRLLRSKDDGYLYDDLRAAVAVPSRRGGDSNLDKRRVHRDMTKAAQSPAVRPPTRPVVPSRNISPDR
jgi:hypothetical protein